MRTTPWQRATECSSGGEQLAAVVAGHRQVDDLPRFQRRREFHLLEMLAEPDNDAYRHHAVRRADLRIEMAALRGLAAFA